MFFMWRQENKLYIEKERERKLDMMQCYSEDFESGKWEVDASGLISSGRLLKVV